MIAEAQDIKDLINMEEVAIQVPLTVELPAKYWEMLAKLAGLRTYSDDPQESLACAVMDCVMSAEEWLQKETAQS